MRIAAGIITWQDGRQALEQAIRSVQELTDELIVIDGPISGIECALPPESPLEWLPECTLRRTSGMTQSQKRSALLHTARMHGADWLLSIDADEQFHQGTVPLRALLASWRGPAFPVRFLLEPGVVAAAAWKLVRVAAWSGWAAGSCYLADRNGKPWLCMGTIDGAPSGWLPWVSHHPELRPLERRALRLGEREFELERTPDGAPVLILPGFTAPHALQQAETTFPIAEARTMNEPDAAPVYYCPQCGARYTGPGICENGHPSAEVIEVVEVAPDQGSSEPATSGEPEPAPAVTEVPSPPEQANLGLATTAELLAELAARAETGGYAGYRTVGA